MGLYTKAKLFGDLQRSLGINIVKPLKAIYRNDQVYFKNMYSKIDKNVDKAILDVKEDFRREVIQLKYKLSNPSFWAYGY